MRIRSDRDLEDVLLRALGEQDAAAWEVLEDELRSAQSFADAGVLTRDRGLVLRLANGAEFQIALERSERPDAPGYECPDCGGESEEEGEFRDHLIDDHGWDPEDAASEIQTHAR